MQLYPQKNRDSVKNNAFLTNIRKIINGIYVFLSLSVGYLIDTIPQILFLVNYTIPQILLILFSDIATLGIVQKPFSAAGNFHLK